MKRNPIYHLVLCSALAALSMTACGPQEKPAELVQLETLRSSEESAQINGAAPDAYKVCTDLTNKAISAWQDNEMTKAKTYAALGQRQYATAKAKASMNDAANRKAAAEKEIQELKLQTETLQAKQDGLEKSIALMKANISDSDTANVEHRIQVAITEREKAVGVEAPLTQKDTFEAAEAKLKEAGEKSASGQRETAGALAEEARLLFAKAYEQAKPAFDKKQLSAQSAERQKAIFTEAQSIVGPSYVFTDIRSTVIVLAAAFEKNKTDILPVKLDALRRIAELIKKYPDATVIIEGHVQKSTKNYFEVSQRRCDAARDYLISQGVEYKRMMTTAKGKETQRYDEKNKADRPLNDRVEIIIALP
ncbi:MAG: OmpA family protein [Proteobacteria bacterium]|nr:OmpA family protein [Pseudomonadota bacterium]